MSPLKKFILKIHRWLGFASGLVVFILGITGAIYAFQDEIQEMTQPYRFVQQEYLPFLNPSELREIAQQKLPGKSVHSISYQGKERAAIASFYHPGKNYYYLMYINPYHGNILQVSNMNRSFFRIILNGHYYLWLPPEIGQPITAIATLIFTVMLISGVVLWWPKKNNKKQRFSIKWNAKWRRVNYDLHAVFGFYVLLIGFVFALTGLVWGFQWFAKGWYFTLSGGKKMTEYYEPHSQTHGKKYIASAPIDRLFHQVSLQNPHAKIIDVHPPENDSSVIEIAVNTDRSTFWKADYHYFDQYSLREIEVKHLFGKLSNATPAAKIMRMNYDIHVGAIAGLPGKILAFFASLIVASLPITGFLIWWGRKNKKSKKKK